MKTVSFFVPGNPRPQPRNRTRIMHGKAGQTFAVNYDPGDAEIWKREIRLAAVDHIPDPPFSGPLALELTFLFPRPKGHYGSGKNDGKLKASAPLLHWQKPDRDNLDKAVMDSLTTVGMFHDDSQVCDGFIKKVWGSPGKTGCQIVITQLTDATEESVGVDHLTGRQSPAVGEFVFGGATQ